jgi:hypothetical protein
VRCDWLEYWNCIRGVTLVGRRLINVGTVHHLAMGADKDVLAVVVGDVALEVGQVAV